ncbi:aldo/keto reductase [Paenibacillus albidus]|uniref:aldo/keto reductase n=1 Tax=Paenibacillus albidus TaxID=2041023 RepID=UPI0035D0F724
MLRTLPLHKRHIPASRIALGCMGLGGDWDHQPITAEHIKQGHEAVDAALSIGINMFDHADIYTRGKAEKVFGQIFKDRPELRENIIIQSKCGIRLMEPGDTSNVFDFSGAHILNSVDGILSRLGIEYIDILLLHRPDPLMDPEEVAAALHKLKAAGKVRHFGVSNMSAGQIKLLQAYCDEPFIVNQLHLSLAQISWVDAGISVNREPWKDITFPEGTLEHCRTENIQIQAWGPLAQGLFSGRSLENQPENIVNTAAMVQRIARERGTTPESIVLSWLMTHTAAIQPVIGTITPQRIKACADADKLELTRKEWYDLYVSSRGQKLP